MADVTELYASGFWFLFNGVKIRGCRAKIYNASSGGYYRYIDNGIQTHIEDTYMVDYPQVVQVQNGYELQIPVYIEVYVDDYNFNQGYKYIDQLSIYAGNWVMIWHQFDPRYNMGSSNRAMFRFLVKLNVSGSNWYY